MSSTKHITQGGQVFSYMLNMFMQVNKRVSFWLIWFFVIFLPLFFWLRLPWETIRNGGLYWWLSLTARGEKALYRVPPVYDIPWNGQVLHATSEQILKDDYMIWAGNMFLQELYLALFWASVAVGVLAFLIFRFLRRLGEKQAQDERMGGRELTDDVKAVAREMHRRGQASSICIDQLPLILNGEVQYLMMYGTPGSGKSNTINKLLKQIRARGDMAIIYDKGCSLIKNTLMNGMTPCLMRLIAAVRTGICSVSLSPFPILTVQQARLFRWGQKKIPSGKVQPVPFFLRCHIVRKRKAFTPTTRCCARCLPLI